VFTHWSVRAATFPLGAQAADESIIKRVAEETEVIFVGAYDQESLVVWHRN
jgi:hypothetical protein